MATDTELAMDRCLVCGHRQYPLVSRLLGGLIAYLLCLALLLGLADLVVLGFRQL